MSRTSHRASSASRSASHGARRAALAFGLAALALVASAAVAAGAQVERTTVTYGATATTPDPSCPDRPCQAVGSVTGFQVSNGQVRNPFLVTTDGRIKSWTLTLAQPTNKQRSFFNGFFGTPPEARLAVLRRIPGTNPPRFNLRRQGAVKVLSPYLGQTVRFGASLKVEKGDIIGITVPTWAPVFSQDLAARNVWRASRVPGACTNATDIRQGKPQETVGRRATYGCRYRAARLLYTATLVQRR